MNVNSQIVDYISNQTEQKKLDLTILHEIILRINPLSQLWFLDGKNSEGKIISNPNIGYGICTLKYTNGSQKDFYRIGISANTSGISIYVFGIEDKEYLNNLIGKTLGKAKITGYCIKFKTLNEVSLEVLESLFRSLLN